MGAGDKADARTGECPMPLPFKVVYPTGCVCLCVAEDNHEHGPAENHKFIESIMRSLSVCVCMCFSHMNFVNDNIIL